MRDHGIIPRQEYRGILRKKPDGLVFSGERIIAVVEYKQPDGLRTDRDIKRAIDQEIDVARALCKLLIVTDGQKSLWINALNGHHAEDQSGNPITNVFHPSEIEDVATIEKLLEMLETSLSASNSRLLAPKLVDPTALATRLWQTIWVATNRSPIICLYNVVELFIFKFLSDLRVLPPDIAFDSILSKAAVNPAEALEFYAINSRRRILNLFPLGQDRTTIINGTIFVTEDGEPVLSQAILFRRCLQHLQAYTEEFGALTQITKQFKTQLYETFLHQEVQALGQYFTPRKVVRSVISMAGLDSPSFQFNDKRIADPFCGVGGFLLEILNMNDQMMREYTPDQRGNIEVPFTLHGFDKGFERDDQRTIILAKANMLIYLSDLLFTNAQYSRSFAKVFNQTFTLFRDNLGTFGHIIKDDKQKYDIIFSNPPYVTRGSSIIKEELATDPRTIGRYPINALGLESLALEWIVSALKPGGTAFIVVPDGILGRVDRRLRDHVLAHCYLEFVISLPNRTFYSNNENTYIMGFTKKHSLSDMQTDPVFTYLVSNIGEQLTSIKREDIVENDLPEMETLYRIFKGDKTRTQSILEAHSLRCKIQSIEKFRNSSHWVIDRWWNNDEVTLLEIEEPKDAIPRIEVDQLINSLFEEVDYYDQLIATEPFFSGEYVPLILGDTTHFELFLGKRLLGEQLCRDDSLIPVYSANVFEPRGFIAESNVTDFDHPVILWGIDGNFEFNVIRRHEKYATTDHTGAVKIVDPDIVPEYLLFALIQQREHESYDRSFRPSLTNMKGFSIQLPVDQDGSFDVIAQQRIAEWYFNTREQRTKLESLKTKLDDTFSRYLAS